MARHRTIGRRMAIALAAVLALCASRASWAQTRRIAVVVGHNVGAEVRPRLRYAENDAAKMARVLIELGGFASPDVHLLRGPRLDEVRGALDQVSAQIRNQAGTPASRVILLFYYSGHSDGQALELGSERFVFGELRSRLGSSGAALRLEIVDSCKSGALLREKGGELAPGFEIRLTDDLSSTGEAVLTSSAEDEAALESQEIGGSYFSHHLVSGLRGAADVSGDGRVTLSEAYQYAFVHTVSATYDTLKGPQRPNYRYDMSGQGDLVLTDVTRRSAGLQLPTGYDRLLVKEESSGLLIAEVQPKGARRLALPPGRYRVLGMRGDRRFATSVRIGSGAERTLHEQELAPESSAPIAVLQKGGVSFEHQRARHELPALSLMTGVTRGVARADMLPLAAQLGVRQRSAGGWEAQLTFATGRGAGFREQSALALVGWGLGRRGEKLFAGGSLRVGGGAVLQTLDRGAGTVWSPALTAGLSARAGAFLSNRLAVELEGWLPGVLLRRDDRTQLVTLPGLMLGLIMPWR
jgi:hypothetical protein